MKRKNYLYLLLIGTLLTLGACSKDNNNNPDPDPGPGPEPLEKGYFSLNLSTGNASVISRGPQTRATEVGTIKEQIVKDVLILLYQDTGTAANDNLAYAWYIEADNDLNHNQEALGNFIAEGIGAGMLLDDSESYYSGPTTTSFRTIGHEVDVQPYKLIVFANPSSIDDLPSYFGFFDWDTGVITIDPDGIFYNFTNLYYTWGAPNWFNDPVTFDEPITTPAFFYGDMGAESEAVYFFMSNANGPVPVPASALKTTAEDAQKSPVFVNIDRALAKVMVNEKVGGTPVYSEGTIHEFEWFLRNVNTKEYLVRHYAPFAHAPATMEEHATSVIVANREYIYATDPNYLAADQDPDEFYHLDRASLYQNWNAWDETESKVVEEYWRYTTENTAELLVQSGANWKQTMTHVQININIHYDFLLSSDSNGSYFSYNEGGGSDPDDWKVFTLGQALSWILTDSWPSEMTKLRDLIGYCSSPGYDASYVPGTSGFKFYGTAGTDLYDADGKLSWLKLATEYYYNADDEPIVIGDNLVDTSIPDATVWYHHFGFNSYEIPIRHYLPGTGSRTSTYAHYGVVRNNVYKLTINSIDGPGIPSKGFISFDVTIQPWYIRESNNELENPRQ